MTRRSTDDHRDLTVKVFYLFDVTLKGSGVFNVGKGKDRSEKSKREQGEKTTMPLHSFLNLFSTFH